VETVAALVALVLGPVVDLAVAMVTAAVAEDNFIFFLTPPQLLRIMGVN